MNRAEWTAFLTRWSREALVSPQGQSLRQLLPADAHQTGWLGATGASEAEIQAAEQRLRSSLPPSYRLFLSVSNGWTLLTALSGGLWPVTQIDWLVTRDPETVAIWRDPASDTLSDAEYLVYGKHQDAMTFRPRYLETALQISDPAFMDNVVFLLNPQVVTPGGEWEAWFLAPWLPGVNRYPSFEDLMLAEYLNFQTLDQHQ